MVDDIGRFSNIGFLRNFACNRIRCTAGPYFSYRLENWLFLQLIWFSNNSLILSVVFAFSGRVESIFVKLLVVESIFVKLLVVETLVL